jgi:hypothetical protein
VTIAVFAILLWIRERRRNAIELLEKFYTSETMLRARLTTQEYLVPGINRPKYQRFADQKFEEIDQALEQGNAQDREDRAFIRAIPSFFYLVNQAMLNRVIPRNRKLWSLSYSYYWIMAIEPRKGTNPDDVSANDPMYEKFEWMLDPKDVRQRKVEFASKKRLLEVAKEGASRAAAGDTDRSRQNNRSPEDVLSRTG